jgi:hypothetical protein
MALYMRTGTFTSPKLIEPLQIALGIASVCLAKTPCETLPPDAARLPGAFGLALVPHPTEDRARVETDAEADEEGDQCYDDAGRAIALLP